MNTAAMGIEDIELIDVTTQAEREQVFRFRYDVYVEEMDRYGDIADHANRQLVEVDDEHARSRDRYGAAVLRR